MVCIITSLRKTFRGDITDLEVKGWYANSIEF